MPEKRLLLFNLRTDADDHILGFATQWINALAPHYDAIDVITTHAGRLAVADNVRVYSIGRERGVGRVRRFVNFYAILGRLLYRHRYVGCFAHMQPLFATLGAPLLRLRGVRLTTWYTHRSITPYLRLATRFSWRIVTAVPTSYPIASPKVRPIGHGIDADFFMPTLFTPTEPPRVVYVARLTDIKRQHVLLHACRDLDCEVILVGDVPDGFDADYKASLIQLVATLGMTERVIFAGAQTPEQVRKWYEGAQVAINLSPVGLFDKAPLEAMSCAVPTLVSNPAFDALLPDAPCLQISDADDPASVRDALASLLALPPDEREGIGRHLRHKVIQHHSLNVLMERLVSVMNTGEWR